MNRTLGRYLYTVQTLKEKYLCVRAVDVAHSLGVSKASVSASLRQLREEGLLEVETDGNLRLTPLGQAQAENLVYRVTFFTQLLTDAGVDPAQAAKDAVALSGEISEASFAALRNRFAAPA